LKFNKNKEILAPFVSIGISIFQSSISMRSLSGLSCPWQLQSRGHTGGCIKVSIFRLSRPSDPPLRIASPIASIVRARINTRITYCDKWKYISSAYSRRCGVRDYLLIDSFRYAHAHSGYAWFIQQGRPSPFDDLEYGVVRTGVILWTICLIELPRRIHVSYTYRFDWLKAPKLDWKSCTLDGVLVGSLRRIYYSTTLNATPR